MRKEPRSSGGPAGMAPRCAPAEAPPRRGEGGRARRGRAQRRGGETN